MQSWLNCHCMKILCVSDTTDSLAFSPQVGEIFKGTDLILSCGDMPIESHDYLSTMLKRDVYYVYGNHNLNTFRDDMDKDRINYRQIENDYNKQFYGYLLDGRCIRDKKTGLLIAGLGGSMRYNLGESQYTEAQMRRRMHRLIPYLLWNKIRYGRYVDILVTHAPPLGIGDGEDLCHKGFECFLTFMDRYRPGYLVHGHVHLDDHNEKRVTQYKGTKVVNIFGCYQIDDENLGSGTRRKDNGR